MIQARELAVGYEGKAILCGVDVALGEGQIVALLGRNGSGKSTLLRTLCGLIPPIAGQVLLRGEELRTLSPRAVARRVAFVPQQETPAFEFTVRQVVAMGRIAAGTGLFETEEDLRRAEDALRQTDLLHLADRSVLKISGGERQRALIARAIAQEARILLLDEPSAHLDLEHQASLVKLLKNLAGQGYSILAALHDLHLASALASHAILVDNGQAAYAGPMADLLRSPQLETVYRVPFTRSGDSPVFPILG